VRPKECVAGERPWHAEGTRKGNSGAQGTFGTPRTPGEWDRTRRAAKARESEAENGRKPRETWGRKAMGAKAVGPEGEEKPSRTSPLHPLETQLCQPGRQIHLIHGKVWETMLRKARGLQRPQEGQHMKLSLRIGGRGSRAGFVRAAMPAQLPEMCDLLSKPVETPGRKVTGLKRGMRVIGSGPGRDSPLETFSHLAFSVTFAGPPVKRISPLGKPRETVGRKAMGAKADVSPPVAQTGTGNRRTQSQPGRRRNVNCFANPEKSGDAKLRGLTRKARPLPKFAGHN
jgi:hypothetical protein